MLGIIGVIFTLVLIALYVLFIKISMMIFAVYGPLMAICVGVITCGFLTIIVIGAGLDLTDDN